MPAPSAVMVIPPTGMIIAGSSLNLTCIVELSSAVDVPVNVVTEWTGPNVIFLPANPIPAVMVSIITYTSTVTVDAAKNGSYICQATITSGGTTSGITDITLGMYFLIAFLHCLNFPLCSSPSRPHQSDGIQLHSYLHQPDLGAARRS